MLMNINLKHLKVSGVDTCWTQQVETSTEKRILSSSFMNPSQKKKSNHFFQFALLSWFVLKTTSIAIGITSTLGMVIS